MAPRLQTFTPNRDNCRGNYTFVLRLNYSDSLLTTIQVLCPLESVPIFVCVGLNYRQHAAEAGVSKIEQEANDIGLTMIRQMPITPYPVIFNKPPGKFALV